MSRRSKLLLACLIAGALPAATNAAIVVTVNDSGANVVASLSGALDLTGLTVIPYAFGLSTAVRPSPGYIGLGSSPLTTGYQGFTGPGVFGPGAAFTVSSSNSGDGFGLDAISIAQTLFLPLNYVSGTQLDGSSTFANTSLAALGLTVGQYVFQAPADTITINIGGTAPPPVPEPATWALMLTGFGLVGGAMRSHSRRTVVTYS